MDLIKKTVRLPLDVYDRVLNHSDGDNFTEKLISLLGGTERVSKLEYDAIQRCFKLEKEVFDIKVQLKQVIEQLAASGGIVENKAVEACAQQAHESYKDEMLANEILDDSEACAQQAHESYKDEMLANEILDDSEAFAQQLDESYKDEMLANEILDDSES